MAKGYRGLLEESTLLKKLGKVGDLHGIIDKINGNNDYWLGIRDDKVMIYYLGGKILEISKSGLLSFNPKYIFHYNKNIAMDKNFLNFSDWLGKEQLLRQAILNYQTKFNKKEKMVQQEIMIRNNKQKDSEWFLVDMEYSVPGISYGRFDMIAVSKKKYINGKHKIALVELKTGTGSFGGTKADKGESDEAFSTINYGSGIAGHINNFYEFLFGEKGMENVERLSGEIVSILANYRELGLYGGKLQIALDDMDMSPENVECIIMCTDIQNKSLASKQASKYIFDSEAASKYCLEKLWGDSFSEKLNKLSIALSLVDTERIIDRKTFNRIINLRTFI